MSCMIAMNMIRMSTKIYEATICGGMRTQPKLNAHRTKFMT